MSPGEGPELETIETASFLGWHFLHAHGIFGFVLKCPPEHLVISEIGRKEAENQKIKCRVSSFHCFFTTKDLES